jgi:hypothetical protein
MTLQVKVTNDITGFILNGGAALIRDDETMVTTVAGPDIVNNTVLAQDPSTLKWTPLINAAATDGTSWPRGIYQGETILAATIQAGDVTDISVIVGAQVALQVDEAKLVFEAGTLDLDTELGPADAAGALKMSMRAALNLLNIYPQTVQNFDQIAPVA